jgi:hypothetical protein
VLPVPGAQSGGYSRTTLEADLARPRYRRMQRARDNARAASGSDYTPRAQHEAAARIGHQISAAMQNGSTQAILAKLVDPVAVLANLNIHCTHRPVHHIKLSSRSTRGHHALSARACTNGPGKSLTQKRVRWLHHTLHKNETARHARTKSSDEMPEFLMLSMRLHLLFCAVVT